MDTHVHEGAEDAILTYKREEAQCLWKRLETSHGERAMESNEAKQERKRIKSKNRLRELRNTITHSNTCIILEEEREKIIESLF